jgi:tetrahydromethanopterin S-methyltransferase subunit B
MIFAPGCLCHRSPNRGVTDGSRFEQVVKEGREYGPGLDRCEKGDAVTGVPLTPDKYGDVLRIVQIVFYSIAAIVTILTYRAARRGLLNTVNTEYQKRVMDRLQRLSEDLYSEFDPSSEMYWPKVRAVHEAVEDINDVFERNRDEILAERKYLYGIPVTKDVQRLRRILDPVISDPFVPDEIRSAVVDLLDNRIQVLESVYSDEFEKYSNDLAKGEHGPFTDLDDVNKIHNRTVEQQRLRGCGIAQIEEEVHEIRALIQDYFDSFNPHRRWWQGKRGRPGKKREAASDS